MELDLQLVQRVRPTVHAGIRRTPIVACAATPGHRVFWKLEGLQVTGSFKVRGPLALRAVQQDTRPWVTSSAGNHGLGVAWAARGATAPHIFVPRTSPQVKRDAIAQWGAHLEVCDTSGYDATETLARAWAREQDACFVSPFDDEVIMAGNGGTLGLEILEQLPHVDTLVVPIGGGGLASGLGCVVRALRPQARLIGVQSTRTCAMATSWTTGRAVLRHEAGDTLAEGLEGGVSERSFAYVRRWFDAVECVEEEEIAAALSWLWKECGVRVEGSAAVVAAWIRRGAETGRTVCGVLTGSNIDADVFHRIAGDDRGVRPS